MKKIRELLGVQSQKVSKKKSDRPCVLTREQTNGLLERDVLKMYEPALKHEGVKINLVENERLDLPTTVSAIANRMNNLGYVWCDGYEAQDWEERNCKYLGIRITPGFVLHETLVRQTWEEYICQWCDKCQARFLTREELVLLGMLWSEVSNMRKVAGDTPLPPQNAVDPYWIKCPEDKLQPHKFCTLKGEIRQKHTESEACLLLAVVN